MLNVSNNENWRADFRMLGDSLQELVEMVVQLWENVGFRTLGFRKAIPVEKRVAVALLLRL